MPTPATKSTTITVKVIGLNQLAMASSLLLRLLHNLVFLSMRKSCLLEEALQRSRQTDQSQVVAWLLAQFQDK